MTVSAAFLVLDPPLDRLAALMELVRPVVHEFVVVVDDRTRPETVDVMSTWPNVTLIPFGWVDDFAAARNAALPHCTGDWILHLDPDELPSRAMLDFIEAVDRGGWQDEKWDGHWYLAPRAYMFWTESWIDGRYAEGHQLDWHVRLFRRGLGRWYKPVHEQVEVQGQLEGFARFARIDEPAVVRAPAGAYLIHSKSSVGREEAQELYQRLEASVA